MSKTVAVTIAALGALVVGSPPALAHLVHTSDLHESKLQDQQAANYAFVPKEPAAGPKLLLFLPGSGSKLESYTDFMQAAADRGFYVIGLAYRNDHSHTDLCGCMAACMGQMEEQNLTGVDRGFYSADAAKGITPKLNSVNHRLKLMATYLKGQTIDGKTFDWTTFLDANGEPAWGRIVVAGHSGGGNLAAWILKNKAPLGAITFSAPNPNLDVKQPTDAGVSPWTATGGHGTCTKNKGLPDWVTPGFGAHLLVYDDVRDHAYTTAWDGHDIPGVIKAIGGLTEVHFRDGGNPSGRWITRETESSASACGDKNPHHSEPITNCAGNDGSGKPAHHGVWSYLLAVALSF